MKGTKSVDLILNDVFVKPEDLLVIVNTKDIDAPYVQDIKKAVQSEEFKKSLKKIFGVFMNPSGLKKNKSFSVIVYFQS